jgi:hypothetical protein
MKTFSLSAEEISARCKAWHVGGTLVPRPSPSIPESRQIEAAPPRSGWKVDSAHDRP